MKNEDFSYLLARLPLAMSLFGHGAVRLHKLAEFSQWMTNSFNKSIIPEILVRPFSYALPIVELIIGFLLLIGLFTRFALALGVLTMLVLIFGSSMIEQWNNVFIQLIYGAYFAILYRYVDYNRQSFDQLIFKQG